MSATHAPIAGSRRRLLSGSRLKGHCNSNERVELTLKLRRKTPLPALTERPQVPMTREEVAAKYGANDADIATVKATMAKYGFDVLASNQAARSVHVAAPIKTIEDVFKVKLFEYSHARGDYRGRTGTLQIPIELNNIVTAVYGMDNRRMIRRRRRLRPAVARPLLTGGNPSDNGYFPAALAKAYNFPAGDGTGEVIGILEFGGGVLPSDLKQFCSDVGVPVPNVKVVSVDGGPTDTDNEASGEVMLDVEVIAGACPGATQVVYFFSSSFDEKAWVDNLSAAIHDQDNRPFILSISWGLSEDDDGWQDGTVAHINETFQEAAMMGVTVCVAAGDDGSADETDSADDPNALDGLAHVDFPGSSPFVLAVGGTDLRFHQASVTETTWKQGNGRRPESGGTGTGGGTGGGVSSKFPRPAFQNGITINSVDPGGLLGRVVPDVAAHAANNGRDVGYFTVFEGNPGPVGGTSGAAPLWASLIARINAILISEKGPGKRAGYLTPVLYQSGAGGQPIGSSACKDIVSGDNISAAAGGYRAGPGYDAATGWGSPNGSKLLDALRSIV
jgi:kumamolisin